MPSFYFEALIPNVWMSDGEQRKSLDLIILESQSQREYFISRLLTNEISRVKSIQDG